MLTFFGESLLFSLCCSTFYRYPFPIDLITSAKKYSKFAALRQIVIFVVASSNFVLERKETGLYRLQS